MDLKRQWNSIFDSVILTTIIIHISVCSEFFGGTNIWLLLTYLVEFFFIIVSIRFINKNYKLNNIEILGILYFIIIFIVSVFSGLQTSQLISLIGRTLEIATMLMLFRINLGNLKNFIYTTFVVLSVCVYINYYFLLLEPNGIMNFLTGEPFYFLGTNYNQIGIKIIIALIFTFIACRFCKLCLINLITLTYVGIHSLIIVGSMTSLVCLILILIISVLPLTRSQNRIIQITSVGCVILFQIFVVFGGEALNGSIIDSFLSFLGKNSTFTGRTTLWAVSDDMFLDSPLWGYGNISANDYLMNEHFRGKGLNPHNFIYNVLHKGGLLLLFVVVGLIKISYREIKVYLKMNDKIAFIIVMSNVTLFIMMLFEVYETIYLFFLLALMYYYPYIIKAKYLN